MFIPISPPFITVPQPFKKNSINISCMLSINMFCILMKGENASNEEEMKVIGLTKPLFSVWSGSAR